MELPVPFAVAEWEREGFTEDDYFAWEEHSPVRWEFRPLRRNDAAGRPLGVIHAMTGANTDHASITMNMLTGLMTALKHDEKQSDHVFNCLMRFHTPDGCHTYPDISIVRGKAEYYRGRNDTLINPILLAEVLSPATEAYDRGEKWASYQTIPSLQHFLLLAADWVRVELYTRKENGWYYQVYEGLECLVTLPVLGVTLALADLYDRIDFEPGA